MEENTAEELGNTGIKNTTEFAGSGEKDHGKGAGIEVRLENESVWSRFHSLGTEMILTDRGRRMFPCCRFRLTGLDPSLSYSLRMEFTPLDDFSHRWNGESWERDGAADPQRPECVRPDSQRPGCVHPDSPAPGQHWMEGPVSFYKVKLTHSSPDRDRENSGVLLLPMRRYMPRLRVIPAYPEPHPDGYVFSFPLTEFYAVTRYQNPRMTRMKIDCNPFMLAFREDESSARLIQDKLGLAPIGRCSSEDDPSGNTGDQQHSSTRPESRGGILSPDGPDPAVVRSGPARSRISRALKPVSSRWSPAPPASDPAGVPRRVRARRSRGAWKPKAKRWSNVRYYRSAGRVNRAAEPDVRLQPDLEDVDGVLFVSFTAKEALDVHVGNMRKSVHSTPASHTHTTHTQMEILPPDPGLTTAERISEQELELLTHLKQLKNRQILHPALQHVGLKLSVLDPLSPIDLHYLGAPLPPPALTPSSPTGFVSRTGKTNDVTRIKGWMEKFSSKTAADSNRSAFCSDMLDEYLASEGQRISDRAAVFSASSPAPVAYQLPVRSQSYVRTLASVLQTRRVFPYTPPALGVRSSSRSSSQRSLQDQHQDHDPPVSRVTLGKVRSRRGRKRRRLQLRFNRDADDGSANSLAQLLIHEEHAVGHGKDSACITSERASFALSSLLTSEPAVMTTQLRAREASGDSCAQLFCRLGCVCESLGREIRGPTHCRRVQCMFSCGCFKHKILLIRSPEPMLMHSASGLMAFPVDPGSGTRPAPALPVTCLWRRSVCEGDPEPLFAPRPAATRALLSHTHTHRPRAQSRSQAQGQAQGQGQEKEKEKEKEKDPVYLFLESMMTCARVREYNSNPPPQVHLLPARRPDEAVNGVSQMLTSQTAAAGAPEPTKMLEIISGCNWESHRSLVLKELFRSIHSDRLSALRSIDGYRVELLSQNLIADATSSTLTYKVCISLLEKSLETAEPRKDDGKPRAERVRNSSQRVSRTNKRANADAGETRANRFPLLSRVAPAGYLTAETKTAVCSGCIKVNGKAYTQAKLCLGRMGALHPANRLAAYLTGRIQPASINSRSQSKPVPVNSRSQSKPAQLRETRDTPHTADQIKAAFRAPATQTLAIYQAPDGIKRTPTLYIFSHVHNPAAPASTSNHVTSSQPGLILTAVAPPLSCATTVAPPLSDPTDVAPPLSGPTAVAPPLSDLTEEAPPLSDLTDVAPPLSGPTAVAPALSDPTAVAPPLSDSTDVAPPLSDPTEVAPPLPDSTDVAPPLPDPTKVAPPLSDPTTVAPPLSDSTNAAPPLSDPTEVAPPLPDSTDVAPPLPDPTKVAPPLSDPTTVAPPLSGPAAVAPSLSGPTAVASPFSDSTDVAPPLSGPTDVAPPLPDLTAVAPPLSGATAVAPPLSDPTAVSQPTVAPPLSPTVTVLPASALAPGQQVVLQPVAGMMGVNMCQFNGQTIQLVPVPSASPVPSAGSAQQEVQTSTQRPRATKSVLNPAPSPKLVPFIAPRILSAPGNSSFTFGSAAHSGFPAKNNMLSFRIFPPASSGLQHTEAGGVGSSVLLPGGYRLIRLPMVVQPAVNPERGPSGSTESPREDAHRSCAPIKAEPSETTLTAKVEPCSESPRTGAVHIKIEPYEEIHQNRDPDAVSTLKAEEPDPDPNPRPSERAGPPPHPTNISGDFSCSLFTSPISAFSKRTFAVAPTQTHTPEAPHTHTVDRDRRREEGQNRIQWLWKRSAPARVSEGSGLAADGSGAALLYSSDGWTTEDSNEKSSEDEVDIEAFGEDEERIIGRLRAKAQRTTARAAPHRRLLKAKLLGKTSHHAVRLMSDLPVYKRTFRLNQALRERKRQVELNQSLDSLRRTLCVEDDSMSTEDLLRQARQVVGALEDHGRSLMAQKRALIQQHSHYQTLISQCSVAGTELHVEQKSAAPSSDTPQSVVKRHSRLPNIVLKSFTSPSPVLNQSINSPSPVLNQSINSPSPVLNQSINSPSPVLNQSINSPSPVLNQSINSPSPVLNQS
ncbi:MAX gene-associated protein isoform X2 [Pimephales promelas]|uniref:MAX gene-associated protein isoform X2 n=1 Tax=Pimephales promelas TaxID=90988 RepID=UPI0019556C37|nr:MAX gene-associated protein isoform X2 [Pimephales promelas]